MIQLDEKELQILISLANRAPKTLGEQYAFEAIVQKCNAQLEATRKEQSQKAA